MKNELLKFRTDIAPEIIDQKTKAMFNFGVRSKVTRYQHEIVEHKVKLAKDNAFNRKKGDYITIDSPEINIDNSTVFEKTKALLVESLKVFFKKKRNILVVGVGNRGLTSDSLGPRTIERINVNRVEMIANSNQKQGNVAYVSVFAPSVAGKTGIESFDIVKCLVNSVKPDLVVVVDSLCSRKLSRIGTSFQLTNVGILPGSGLGVAPSELSKETLGVQTIAIGVPMVVYASELAMEILFSSNEKSYKYLNEIKKGFAHDFSDLVVTPKNIDEIIHCASELISQAINDCVNI